MNRLTSLSACSASNPLGLPLGAFLGGRFGWLQSLADGIKLIQKEDLAPDAADKFLFRLSPYIVVAAAFAAFIFIPMARRSRLSAERRTKRARSTSCTRRGV